MSDSTLDSCIKDLNEERAKNALLENELQKYKNKATHGFNVAYKAMGNDKYPPIPNGAITHLYFHGNKTKCGIEMDERFVIGHFKKAKVTCKKCSANF
jgi:hypothetical protein